MGLERKAARVKEQCKLLQSVVVRKGESRIRKQSLIKEGIQMFCTGNVGVLPLMVVFQPKKSSGGGLPGIK